MPKETKLWVQDGESCGSRCRFGRYNATPIKERPFQRKIQGKGLPIVDDDVDDSTGMILWLLNVDHIFEADECDALTLYDVA
ncbi:hypothetical protein Tco_0680898 [Tanacetum coccineum]|uniref:Uncharacterized protein n=1 Tax=Tanacetum coccineum TaxID=301880 RepID=A0ABQ4XLS4_9ASTR